MDRIVILGNQGKEADFFCGKNACVFDDFTDLWEM